MLFPNVRRRRQQHVVSLVRKFLPQKKYHFVAYAEAPLEFQRIKLISQQWPDPNNADSFGSHAQLDHFLSLVGTENENAVGLSQEPKEVPHHEPADWLGHPGAEIGRDEEARAATARE